MINHRVVSFTILLLLPLAAIAAPARAATTESISDDAMERAAEKLINDNGRGGSDKSSVTSKPTGTEKAAAASDEDLPVAVAEAAPPKSTGSVIWRLLASVGVLAAAGLGLHYASRRFTRGKNVGGTESRIEMMHQYHLGPRKSLALVRVAGETMLVGITDHNINMLKSITLIDDDMAATMNQDFNGFLEEEFAVSDVNHIGRRNQ